MPLVRHALNTAKVGLKFLKSFFFSLSCFAAETTDSDSASHNSTHRDEKGKYFKDIRIGKKLHSFRKLFLKNYV